MAKPPLEPTRGQGEPARASSIISGPDHFMTDSKKHLADAESALALVKTEAQLMAWHDLFMSSDDYAGMADADARTLEALYRKKALWFWGALA